MTHPQTPAHDVAGSPGTHPQISIRIVPREDVMLEALTGRLKWEQNRYGIRVVIPARLSWGATRGLLTDLGAYLVGFLCIFVIAGCIGFVRGLSFHSFLESHGMHSLYISAIGCCTGLVLAKMVPRLFGETVVTLSPTQITIEWNTRIRRLKEVFPTATVRAIRFVERTDEVAVKNKIAQNEIQFVQAQSTHHFGEGLTREEAETLIAKMTEVYPFPS